MHDLAIRFTGVSKRFRRGEQHDSLRDLLPSLVRRLSGRGARRPDERDFWALTDVNLVVHRGEALGVIGHNGAGKSTMLKHLAGIMTPTHGRIEVNGRLSALIEVGAGFHPDLTGRENVFLSGVILGMSRAEVARKFEAIVDFAGIRPFIDTPVKRYSSGMFARLGFAVAAHLEPDILVIDEVLSVGDFLFQQKSLQRMREIARGGATVIFVSHNLKAVADLCSRTVLLDRGTIVADGPTGDVIQTYLSRERSRMLRSRDVDVEIDSVSMTRNGQSAVELTSGDKVEIRVSFTARRPTNNVSVVVGVLDESLEKVFYTSAAALGVRPVDLRSGTTAILDMELTLHLANGTFHLGVWLHDPADGREIDGMVPAITFIVGNDAEIRGTTNLYPVVRSLTPQEKSAVSIEVK